MNIYSTLIRFSIPSVYPLFQISSFRKFHFSFSFPFLFKSLYIARYTRSCVTAEDLQWIYISTIHHVRKSSLVNSTRWYRPHKSHKRWYITNDRYPRRSQLQLERKSRSTVSKPLNERIRERYEKIPPRVSHLSFEPFRFNTKFKRE